MSAPNAESSVARRAKHEWLCTNTIHTLAIDAVEGAPMTDLGANGLREARFGRVVCRQRTPSGSDSTLFRRLRCTRAGTMIEFQGGLFDDFADVLAACTMSPNLLFQL